MLIFSGSIEKVMLFPDEQSQVVANIQRGSEISEAKFQMGKEHIQIHLNVVGLLMESPHQVVKTFVSDLLYLISKIRKSVIKQSSV